VRGSAGFNADKARKLPQRTAEPRYVAAAGAQSLSPKINAMHLKDVLRGSSSIVVTPFMDGSPLAVPQQQPQFGTLMPVARARPQHRKLKSYARFSQKQILQRLFRLFLKAGVFTTCSVCRNSARGGVAQR
jgi:hypothetical protein